MALLNQSFGCNCQLNISFYLLFSGAKCQQVKVKKWLKIEYWPLDVFPLYVSVVELSRFATKEIGSFAVIHNR